MTAVEKWNAAAPTLDLIVALAMIAAGIVILCLRRKIRTAQEARAAHGQLSIEAAHKLANLATWSGIGSLGLGICLTIIWALGG